MHLLPQFQLTRPPVGADRLVRSRLLEAIGLPLPRRVSVAAAPSGYGKSIAFAQYVDVLETASVWLNLTHREKSLDAFLALVAAALTSESVDLARPVLDLLDSPAPLQEDELSGQLSACFDSLDGDLLIVLDDYHAAESPAVNSLVESLLLYATPFLRIAILSRTRPAVRLSRLRSRGDVCDITPSLLVFTDDEICQLVAERRPVGSDAGEPMLEVAQNALAATGGWPAGVVLALREDVSPHTPGYFAGAGPAAIHELLSEEVIELLSSDLQEFLSVVALFDRFSLDLATAATGWDCANHLEEALRRELFLQPAAEAGWFQFAPFFRDVLRSRQGRRAEAEDIHRRAAAWFEEAGYFDEAIEHATTAGDYERADRLFSILSHSVWGGRRREALQAWAETISGGAERPGLSVEIYRAGTYLNRGQLDLALAAARRASELVRGDFSDDGVGGATDPIGGAGNGATLRGAGAAAGRLSLINASISLMTGDFAGMEKHSSRAVELLSDREPALASMAQSNRAVLAHWSPAGTLRDAIERYSAAASLAEAAGNGYLCQSCIFQMAVATRMTGAVNRAATLLDSIPGVEVAEEALYPGVVGPAASERAAIEARRGNLNRCWSLLEQGLEMSEVSAGVLSRWWSLCRAVQAHIDYGEQSVAKQLLERLYRIAATRQVAPWFATLADALEGRLLLREGDALGIEAWISRRGLTPEIVPTPAREAELETYALALAEQRIDSAAIEVTTGLMEVNARRGRYNPDLALVHSGMLHRSGREADAVEVAVAALYQLEFAGEESAPRLLTRFVLPLEAGLLHTIRERKLSRPSTKFVGSLMSPGGPTGALSHGNPEGSVLVESLSDREIELLSALAEGRSNMEIAEDHFISLNTVKTHLKNIYAKLDVTSRTMAVACARELRLLE